MVRLVKRLDRGDDIRVVGAAAPRAVAADRLTREDPMIRLRGPRDPFWDDGRGAQRTHRRLRVEGLIAIAIAIVACGLTVAMWMLTLAPLGHELGLN